MKYLFITLLGQLFFLQGIAQVSISGPDCVTTNIVYEYKIGGLVKDQPLSICLQGGSFYQFQGDCIYDSLVSLVRVVWNSSIQCNLKVSLNGTVVQQSVVISDPLIAGEIDSASKFTSVISTEVPTIIHCSPAFGGHCEPAYSYVWQKSTDNMFWADLPECTSPELQFFNPIAVSSFFRRKTHEKISNSIVYSDAAFIAVINQQ